MNFLDEQMMRAIPEELQEKVYQVAKKYDKEFLARLFTGTAGGDTGVVASIKYPGTLVKINISQDLMDSYKTATVLEELIVVAVERAFVNLDNEYKAMTKNLSADIRQLCADYLDEHPEEEGCNNCEGCEGNCHDKDDDTNLN